MTTSTDTILLRFRRCTSAEEYFDLLQVAYDPAVVQVYRLHILRHFSQQLVMVHEERTEPETAQQVLARYRELLAASYQTFVTDTALDHRLFKVLKDRAPNAFVPITEVVVERPAEAGESAS